MRKHPAVMCLTVGSGISIVSIVVVVPASEAQISYNRAKQFINKKFSNLDHLIILAISGTILPNEYISSVRY